MLLVKNILSASQKLVIPGYDCFEAYVCNKEKSGSEKVRERIGRLRAIPVVVDLGVGLWVAGKILSTLDNRFKVVSTLAGTRIGLTLAGAGWIALSVIAVKALNRHFAKGRPVPTDNQEPKSLAGRLKPSLHSMQQGIVLTRTVCNIALTLFSTSPVFSAISAIATGYSLYKLTQTKWNLIPKASQAYICKACDMIPKDKRSKKVIQKITNLFKGNYDMTYGAQALLEIECIQDKERADVIVGSSQLFRKSGKLKGQAAILKAVYAFPEPERDQIIAMAKDLLKDIQDDSTIAAILQGYKLIPEKERSKEDLEGIKELFNNKSTDDLEKTLQALEAIPKVVTLIPKKDRNREVLSGIIELLKNIKSSTDDIPKAVQQIPENERANVIVNAAKLSTDHLTSAYGLAKLLQEVRRIPTDERADVTDNIKGLVVDIDWQLEYIFTTVRKIPRSERANVCSEAKKSSPTIKKKKEWYTIFTNSLIPQEKRSEDVIDGIKALYEDLKYKSCGKDIFSKLCDIPREERASVILHSPQLCTGLKFGYQRVYILEAVHKIPENERKDVADKSRDLVCDLYLDSDRVNTIEAVHKIQKDMRPVVIAQSRNLISDHKKQLIPGALLEEVHKVLKNKKPDVIPHAKKLFTNKMDVLHRVETLKAVHAIPDEERTVVISDELVSQLRDATDEKEWNTLFTLSLIPEPQRNDDVIAGIRTLYNNLESRFDRMRIFRALCDIPQNERGDVIVKSKAQLSNCKFAYERVNILRASSLIPQGDRTSAVIDSTVEIFHLVKNDPKTYPSDILNFLEWGTKPEKRVALINTLIATCGAHSDKVLLHLLTDNPTIKEECYQCLATSFENVKGDKAEKLSDFVFIQRKQLLLDKEHPLCQRAREIS